MGVNVVIILLFCQHWRYYPRQEPDAVILHVRIRAGGRPRGRFLPRHMRISNLENKLGASKSPHPVVVENYSLPLCPRDCVSSGSESGLEASSRKPYLINL